MLAPEGKAGDYLAVLDIARRAAREGRRTYARPRLRGRVGRDYSAEIAGTFERIQRPLRWPMESYRRRKVSSPSFVGYRFSRVKGSASAGFAYGFALRADEDLGIRVPPEAVIYAFVRPAGSRLYRNLVTRPGSPVRRLAARSRSLAYPFELHLGPEIAAVRHRTFARHPPELFVIGAADFFMIAQQPLRVGGFIEGVRKATDRPGP